MSFKSYRSPVVADISMARWMLLAVLAAATYFFHGFLVPVLAASVIAVATWPLRRRAGAVKGTGRTMAAAVMLLAIVVLLVLPIAMAIYFAAGEVRVWIYWGIGVNAIGYPTPEWMTAMPHIGDWLDHQYQSFIGTPGALGHLLHALGGSSIGSLYRGVISVGSVTAHMALTGLFTLITLFVFYRDGQSLMEQIDTVGQKILPGRWDRLSRIIPATISSTMTGMTLIAIGEGLVLGVAYWLAGVPSPIVFGVITGFMALVPGGAPLCFTLLSAYLVASGSIWSGAGLFAWGAIELFIVDKTIRPTLVGGPVKLPFLPTFFGLIGGVKTLGIIGLFVGPVLMAILVTMWREWLREIDADKRS